LSTASYDNVSFSVSGQDTSPFGIAFRSDGTKMYMLGNNSDSVYQYRTKEVFNVIFPSGVNSPEIPLRANEKTALTIVTTDGGTSYDVVKVQGGIK
jgi:DNA-binding beta-propeller fold protein YncE